MELDRHIFSSVENVIRMNPAAGLNGQLERFRGQLNVLGKTATEFTKSTTANQRQVVRRAVKAALGLNYVPNNVEVAATLNNFYAAAELTGSDPEIRNRIHIFARYIGSTAP